jgi:membrane protease YdiL (CAAX protease family)
VPAPRERRELAPFEAASVLATAFIPFGTVPVALPLLAVATVFRYLRGRSWAAVTTGSVDRAALGALAGVLAVTLSVMLGTPFVESLGTRAIQWSQFPIVRGSATNAAVAIILVAATSLAMELALRGWIVERVLELWPGGAGFPIFVGAVAEALVTPGELHARLGAALFGAGLGWIYCAAGRSIVAPALARIAFQAGAVVLEALQLVG